MYDVGCSTALRKSIFRRKILNEGFILVRACFVFLAAWPVYRPCCETQNMKPLDGGELHYGYTPYQLFHADRRYNVRDIETQRRKADQTAKKDKVAP